MAYDLRHLNYFMSKFRFLKKLISGFKFSNKSWFTAPEKRVANRRLKFTFLNGRLKVNKPLR